LRVLPGFRLHAFGKIPGLLQHEFIIEQRERLQCGGGRHTHRREIGRVRTIERRQELLRRRSHHETINTPAPQFRPIRRDIAVDGRVGLGVIEVAKTRTAHRRVQLPADREHRVMQGLGVQSARIGAPEEAILRIHRSRFHIELRRLPVGAARDDEALHGLQRPTAGQEFVGQPIQQLGMRWPVAAMPKVARRTDDPLPKKIVPQSVYDYATGEWIARVRE